MRYMTSGFEGLLSIVASVITSYFIAFFPSPLTGDHFPNKLYTQFPVSQYAFKEPKLKKKKKVLSLCNSII
jgi:hypothetical protein